MTNIHVVRILVALFLLAFVPGAALAACPRLLDHTVPGLVGNPTSLCQFQGKVLLVVNTASQCGYTPQYKSLEALYERYRQRGLVVLGFPSNDFGGQEPGSAKQIAEFCQVNFGVSFPMFAKTGVAAGHASALYEDLARQTGARPQWNFHKYLIDRSGKRVQSFASAVRPDSPDLVGAIERLLAMN